MSTPISVSSLQTLVRGAKIDQKTWKLLLDQRLRLIAPHLDSMTLRTLGSIEILRGGRSPLPSYPFHSLDEDKPQFDGDLTPFLSDVSSTEIAIQGIWDFSLHEGGFLQRRLADEGKRRGYAWGISRRTKSWVLVVVDGVPGEYEVAKNFKVIPAPIETILDVGGFVPAGIWGYLGRCVKQFAEDRYRLHQKAEELARIVSVEESVAWSIQANEAMEPKS